MTRGREHLVLRRSDTLDGRTTDSFLRDCGSTSFLADTLDGFLDAYTWFREQERIGAFDATSFGSDRNPVTPELLAVFRMLPQVEWRAADTVPLRVEARAVVCASARECQSMEEMLRAELRQPIRVVGGLPSAIRERIVLLAIHAQERRSRAA